MHRPWMPDDALARRHLAGTLEHRVFQAMVRLAEVRRTTASLTAGGDTFIHRYDDPAVLAYERRHPVYGRCFCVVNVAARPAQLPAQALEWSGVGAGAPEVLGWGQATVAGDVIRLAPLGAGWFTRDADWRVLPVTKG
jgi:glycosidase